ncbi:MAG: DUF4445 domain-containing protein [Deltaproteobacteria bacterium]|nr:MAG: DUF4445 domain-containing protein [Deltaproteobacteria bacterium]
MPETGKGTVRFLPDGIDVPLSPGISLLRHALEAGIPLLAPCGGESRCGKCRVSVEGETRGGDDSGLLSPSALAAGVRLACRCFPVSGDVRATVPPESRTARLAAYLDGKDLSGDGPFLPLPRSCAGMKPVGVALDLGTSTLAAALVDLCGGAVLSRASADNPQMGCGEDLISRVVFAEETQGGFDLSRGRLLSGVDGLIATLLSSAPAGAEVTDVVVAGNTVLSHFLYGLDPSPIRRPPYRPGMKEYPVVDGKALGVSTAREAQWRLFPSLGGFVGGDVVAGILASGMHRNEEVSLLFDVGTNGEVALGNRDWRIACSSSAGPAFEGGDIGCGMRAYPGAIESVRIDRGTEEVEFTVIGRGRPAGLCGSGVIDLCAEMFRAGIVDRAGRFTPGGGNARRRRTEEGCAFVVVPPEESADGRGVWFGESDMKSVLRTKAALSAAAESMLRAVGFPRDAVARVYIAGGFGNFIDLRSALAIGLFPPFPPSRFVPLGNASLAGAIGALRNRRRWKEALALASSTLHHDLSLDPDFMELYQRALFLPHTDEESYRAALAAGGPC